MPVFFYKVAGWFRRLWQWIRRNWKWVVGGLTAFILTVLIYRALKSGRAGDLRAAIMQHQIKVLTAENQISRLEGQRDIIRKQTVDVVERIRQLDLKVNELSKEIVESRSAIDRLTAEEKLRKFQELGY